MRLYFFFVLGNRSNAVDLQVYISAIGLFNRSVGASPMQKKVPKTSWLAYGINGDRRSQVVLESAIETEEEQHVLS